MQLIGSSASRIGRRCIFQRVGIVGLGGIGDDPLAVAGGTGHPFALSEGFTTRDFSLAVAGITALGFGHGSLLEYRRQCRFLTLVLEKTSVNCYSSRSSVTRA